MNIRDYMPGGVHHDAMQKMRNEMFESFTRAARFHAAVREGFNAAVPMRKHDIIWRRQEAIMQWAEGNHNEGRASEIKTLDQMHVLYGTSIAAVRVAVDNAATCWDCSASMFGQCDRHRPS